MNRRWRPDVAPAPRVEPESDAEPTASDAFDLSMAHVPADWVDAQIVSPLGTGDTKPLSGTARFSAIPTSNESPFISNVAALGAAFLAGTAWFLVESFGVSRGPWLTVAVGAFIGFAVRLPAVGDRSYRAMVSVAAYLLTVLAVLILVTHRDLSTIYGSNYDFQEYEDTLIRTRFRSGLHLLAYGVGAVAAAKIGSLPKSARK